MPISKGNYIIVVSDDTNKDNKPLSPYLCGKLLRQLGCVSGYCYINANIELGIDSDIVLSYEVSDTDETTYLIIE